MGSPVADTFGCLYSQLSVNGVPVTGSNALPVYNAPSLYWISSGTLSAAGTATIYTPPAGKTIVLYGVQIYLSGDATMAVAGRNIIEVLDAAQVLSIRTPYLPAVSANMLGDIIVLNLGLESGYKFAAINDPLNIAVGTALATGLLNIVAWGDYI
jgi:hypothetical protein